MIRALRVGGRTHHLDGEPGGYVALRAARDRARAQRDALRRELTRLDVELLQARRELVDLRRERNAASRERDLLAQELAHVRDEQRLTAAGHPPPLRAPVLAADVARRREMDQWVRLARAREEQLARAEGRPVRNGRRR